MQNPEIVVFGSEGFIGRRLIDILKIEKRSFSGYDVHGESKGNSIKGKFFGSDKEIEEIISRQPKVVINCAGSASVPKSFEDPMNDFMMNTHLIIRLLNSIHIKSPNTYFINLSSAAIYGQPEKLPITEDSIVNPLSPYGYNKWISEILCLEYKRFFKVKSCSLRVFSSFGPGLKKQLFWDLYLRSLESKDGKVELFGTGSETRDFIYVDDLVRAILRVADARPDFDVINVGSGEETSISEAASVFFNEVGGVEAVFSGLEKTGDPKKWRADISRLSSIGFKPEFSFIEGIINYVKWLKSSEN